MCLEFKKRKRKKKCLFRNVETVIRIWFWDDLPDLVPFVIFKNREKHPWRIVAFSKVETLACTFTKSNTPPLFFTVFRLYEWDQIAQRITFKVSTVSNLAVKFSIKSSCFHLWKRYAKEWYWLLNQEIFPALSMFRVRMSYALTL